MELQGDSDATRNVSATVTNLTVSYDAPSKSYTLNGWNGGTSVFTPADMEPPEGGLITYSHDTDTESSALLLTQAGHIYNLGVRYVGAGYWQQVRTSTSGALDLSFDAFTYGIDTPVSAIPRTGAAGYTVLLVGFAASPGSGPRVMAGDGVFSVEFASGNFSAAGTAYDEDLLIDHTTTHRWAARGTLRSGTNAFEGDFRYVGRDPTELNGPISGRFYGPEAQELGAVFRVSNPEGSVAVGTLIGARDNDVAQIASTALPIFHEREYFGSLAHWGLVTKTDGSMVEGPSGFSSDTHGYLSFTGKEVLVDPAMSDGAVPTRTFTEANISAELSNDRYTVYRRTEGSTEYQLTLAVPGPGNPEMPLTYSSFGIWQRSLDVAGGRQQDNLWLVYGVMTQPGSMGRTGTASYDLQIKGSGVRFDQQAKYDLSGDGSLRIDLASLKYEGRLAPTASEVGGSRTLAFAPMNFSGNFTSDSYIFQSALSSSPGNSQGSIDGRLFGPRGSEFGGSFDFKTRGANDVDNGAFSGIAFGKRD